MEGITDIGLGYLSAALGAGMVAWGAGLGISRIAAAACEGIARQPEAAGDIRISMLITAAMIEVIGLIGAVSCIMMALRT